VSSGGDAERVLSRDFVFATTALLVRPFSGWLSDVAEPAGGAAGLSGRPGRRSDA